MLKDLWKIVFFTLHFALIIVLHRQYGVPGTFMAIGAISAFWFLKGKVAPEADLWPDQKPEDLAWPESLKKTGNFVGAGIGWLLVISMGLGLLGA